MSITFEGNYMGPNSLRLFHSMMTPIYRQNMNKIGVNQLGRFPRKYFVKDRTQSTKLKTFSLCPVYTMKLTRYSFEKSHRTKVLILNGALGRRLYCVDNYVILYYFSYNEKKSVYQSSFIKQQCSIDSDISK